MDPSEPSQPPDGFGCRTNRQTKSPGVAHVGTWHYDEQTVGSHRLNVALDSSDGQQVGIASAWEAVRLVAHLYFPADHEDATAPSQISTWRQSYPLIVLPCEMDAAGHDALLAHLARNGFIASCIELPAGLAALGQADVLFEHLTIIREAFGSSLWPSIGLLGCCGTAVTVLDIARLSRELGLDPGIDAAIGLAADSIANDGNVIRVTTSFFKRCLGVT